MVGATHTKLIHSKVELSTEIQYRQTNPAILVAPRKKATTTSLDRITTYQQFGSSHMVTLLLSSVVLSFGNTATIERLRFSCGDNRH